MCIEIGPHNWLYPRPNSFGRYLNHSCNPNCGIKGNEIVSIEKIVPGEEITIDYSTTTIDKTWGHECFCGAINCKKFIRSVQYLPKNIFNKYKDYMPAYVRNNYPQNG
jgi:SET domain-containing protein